jgi:hypothetical protein
MGLKASRGKLVIFMDDDELAMPQFLDVYAKALQRHTDASFFGGRIIPEYERPPARWFLDQVVPRWPGIVGRYDLGDRERAYASGATPPFGGNFALFRDKLPDGMCFRTDLGVTGNKILLAEETELFGRLLRDRHDGFYLPSAVVHHFTPAAHLTERYVFRWLVGYWISTFRMDGYEVPDVKLLAGIPRYMIRQFVKSFVAYAIRRLLRRSAPDITELERLSRRWAEIRHARDCYRSGTRNSTDDGAGSS